MAISRRQFLTGLGAGAAATTLGGCATWDRFFGEYKQPNIIYILADDLGYGDLGCYGQRRIKTPHLDRMAAEGMRFTQHYAGSTVCAPSRCVLMTGLHTGHCRIRGNIGGDGQRVPLSPEDVTVAELLKQQGYATGLFGKWGLGEPDTPGIPNRQGFDTFYGYLNQGLAHNYYPEYLWHNEEKVPLEGKAYSHDLILSAAKDFIRTHHDRPFFCYLPVTIPHAAMHAPQGLHEKYRKQFPEFDDRIGKYSGPDVQNPVAAFAAMMEHLDNGVGEILAMLQSLGIDDNTVVMFTSDNGPHREGGQDPDFFNSNGPLRGIKRDLYEGGIRVPFLVRWPGRIAAGRVSDHVSGFQDVLTTCVELAGGAAPSGLDGISFLPTLTGNTRRQQEHDYLYWEFHEQGGKQAVRRGNWKAVRLNAQQNPDGPIELYDLSRDIGEKNNVAAKNKSVVEQMAARMQTSRLPSPEFPFFSFEQ